MAPDDKKDDTGAKNPTVIMDSSSDDTTGTSPTYAYAKAAHNRNQSKHLDEIESLKKVGRYEIREKLGFGGTGVVFLGYDPFIKRKVAVKVSHGTSEMYRKLFFLEAQSAGRLHHPNIVTVHDSGLHGDFCYIVMEYINGVTLREHCSINNLLPVGQVVEIISNACQAIHYAHREGVVHKDIKPSNIMLDSVGAVKITDFGIAQVSSTDLSGASTKPSDDTNEKQEKLKGIELAGTPSYMSPEQLRTKVVGRESDIFSLGCVLYELLTGQKAFDGDTLLSVLYKIEFQDPPPVTGLNSSLPPEFDNVLSLALDKDPEKRHLNCADLAHHLRTAYKQMKQKGTDARDFFDFVNSVPFFISFTRDQVRELVTASNVVRVKPGQFIIREGEMDDTLYVVLAGKLRVVKGGVYVAQIERGECFGEMALLSNQPRLATVEAETKCTLMKIKSSLLSKSSEAVQLLFFQRFAKTLSGRLSALL